MAHKSFKRFLSTKGEQKSLKELEEKVHVLSYLGVIKKYKEKNRKISAYSQESENFSKHFHDKKLIKLNLVESFQQNLNETFRYKYCIF